MPQQRGNHAVRRAGRPHLGSRRRILAAYRLKGATVPKALRVAINGAGIAGPTLAYWLRQLGHAPMLFEKAARPRACGFVIDFWGSGYDVAERMGLIDRFALILEVVCSAFPGTTLPRRYWQRAMAFRSISAPPSGISNRIAVA